MAKPVANILLDEIETSQEYKDMVAETQSVLMEQWEDIIASGIIKEMYDQFDSTFRKRVDKASKIRETINRLILSGKV